MAAHCGDCGWTGTSMQVVDGGRCPACASPIRYDRAPVSHKVIDSEIKTVFEFNRRAAFALRGINFGLCARFPQNMILLIERGHTPSQNQQQGIFNTIMRYRRQVTDKAVLSYAELRAKGAD